MVWCESKWRPVLKYNFLDSYLFCVQNFCCIVLKDSLICFADRGEGGNGTGVYADISFHEFYIFFFYLFIYFIFILFFLYCFFTHDIYPHPHPRPTTTTHDPRPTAFSYTRPVPVGRPFKFKYCHASGRLGKVRLRPRRPHVSGCFWIRNFFTLGTRGFSRVRREFSVLAEGR